MKANQKTKRTPKQEVERLPETIEERVHRHISDINSKITDDDIKSVRTELDIRRNSTDQPTEEKSATPKRKRNSDRKKNNGENDPEKEENPGNLLNEPL